MTTTARSVRVCYIPAWVFSHFGLPCVDGLGTAGDAVGRPDGPPQGNKGARG